MFMGSTQDASDMLGWTCEQQGIQIAAVVGDPPLQERARTLGLTVLTLEEVYEKFHAAPDWCDLVISYLYWRILKSPIIDAPRYGCINFHPAPLPDYKGRGGCSFAILHQLTKWGCTAHYIDSGIDTGNIIDVRWFPFRWQDETGISLKKKTGEEQKVQYKEVFAQVVKMGVLPAERQVADTGRYISKQEMLEAMRIRPEKDNIDAKIQAFWFPPHDGAFIELNGKRYTLVNEVVLKQEAEKQQSSSDRIKV